MPQPFEFQSVRTSVIKIRREGVDTWYHLTQRPRKWALRTFSEHGPTATYYTPGLVELPVDDAEIKEQLSLEEVERRTGLTANKLPVTRSAEWQEILQTLADRQEPPAGGGGGDVALGGLDPDEGEPGVPGPQIIPSTDLHGLYSVLKDFSSLACQLAIANEAGRDGAAHRLGDRCRRSVEQFAFYDNVAVSFVPDAPPRAELPNPEGIQFPHSTRELTTLLVNGADGHGQVQNDPTLNFNFVDREIVAARTPGGAFGNQEPPARATRLDWLLRNANDHQMIIAEVKVGNDKNPFFALVQCLMYASELVTAPQLARVARHYPNVFEPPIRPEDDEQDPSPAADVYIVLCGYNWRSPLRAEIAEVTEMLSESLAGQASVSRHIRRIACLEARVDDKGQLYFESLFAFPQNP